MDTAALDQITDVATLRQMVREQLAGVAEREAVIERRDRHIERLNQEVARLRRIRFAARSERMDPTQREMFEEAVAQDIAELEAKLDDARSKPATPAKRRKPRRRTLPDDLPRETTVHEPEHCDCRSCGGRLVKLKDHVSEKLDVKPLEFFVRREVYPQYACRRCETVVAEPVAPAIIDRGLAAPGLLAHVAIQKYTDHLPLYRQETIFARHGIDINRSNLAEWIGVIGLRLQPLVNALRKKLLAAPVLHADETPVSQLDPGAGKTKRAYLFAYATAGDKPIVLFDHCASRAGQHAAQFLGDWRGTLMVDDYAGYKQLFRQGVTELACWAHARRKFHDAWKASGSEVAKQALDWIGQLYQIEAKLRDLDDAARGRERQRHAVLLLDDFKAWLKNTAPTVLGNSGTSRAINYTLKRWDALRRVLDDGAWPLDNNRIERAIRPVAVGRKNWLFAGSATAGRRAAAIMSLIATAKANGIEPHEWLTDVLTRLPTTKDRDIASLLPLA